MSENQEEIAQQVEVPLVAEPVNYQVNEILSFDIAVKE